MAKISARGATEVARCIAFLGDDAKLQYEFVLRSDRAILRKGPIVKGQRATWKGFRKLHDSIPCTFEGMRSILRPLGYRVGPEE